MFLQLSSFQKLTIWLVIIILSIGLGIPKIMKLNHFNKVFRVLS